MENINPSLKTRGDYLRALRKSKNLTLEAVATDLGHSTQAIANLERLNKTKLDTFIDLVTYYKLENDVILSLMGLNKEN